MDVGKGVDALDLQFTEGLGSHATVRAIGVSLQLALEPVDGWVAGSTRTLRRSSVLGKIEVAVDGLQGADGSAFQRCPGFHEGGEEVPVPDEAFHLILRHRRNESIAFCQSGRERFVHHDVLAGPGGPPGEVTVALGFRADHHQVAVREGCFHIPSVGNAVLVCEELIALVNPVGAVGVVGHRHQLETGMGRHRVGQVVVFDNAQDEGAVDMFRHGRPPSGLREHGGCPADSRSRAGFHESPPQTPRACSGL